MSCLPAAFEHWTPRPITNVLVAGTLGYSDFGTGKDTVIGKKVIQEKG